MRVADYIISRLHALGVDTCFLVTGGGAMHLNDAIGMHPGIRKIYCHHEQAAAIAAEAYARIAKKPALLNVTSGPGGINALNGVFGAYTDSIPLIVVSGQVKTETIRAFNQLTGLRQLGDQEVDIVSMAVPITKWAVEIEAPGDIVARLDEAFEQATCKRPGPVWIDVPVDIQGAQLPAHCEQSITQPIILSEQPSDISQYQFKDVLQALRASRRPVIFAGSGIKIAGVESELLDLAETLNVPVATAWTHDIFPNDHRLYAGRPGTIGTRAGNFIVQNADLLIILGSRLNIRQVSYNWASFAKLAKKIWVDIDAAEFRKPTINADLKIQADLRHFLPALLSAVRHSEFQQNYATWRDWCTDVTRRYTPKVTDYPQSEERINAYHFIAELFCRLGEHDIVACGDATATIVPFQIGKIKRGMRMFSNSGCASMGYDIPAALGAAIADPGARVICLAGDGSSMMNIQELETIRNLDLNVTVFILSNDGYLSIRQTQKNFFQREAGSSTSSGLSFPNFKKLGDVFGFESIELDQVQWESKLDMILNIRGPVLCSVNLDIDQEFEPRLKSKIVDGVISTPELDDMYPFLSAEELSTVRNSAQMIN